MAGEKNAVAVKGENSFITMFRDKGQSELEGFLNNNGGSMVKFVSSMSACFRANPKLNNCSQDSLFGVFMKCAEFGLYPSTVTGECYVIPYKDEATFQLGYQGMITLAYRSGVKRICSEIVYKNDAFDYSFGLNPTLKHVPNIFGDRGEAVGAYAVAILDNGESVFKIMSKDKIFEFRAKSQGYMTDLKYKKTSSPWQECNDPELNMWKKTCVRQLFKMLPKSPTMKDAIAADVKADINNDAIDAETVDVMSQSEITAWYKDLVNNKGYSTDFVTAGMIAIIERTELTGMTKDEAAKIEKWLCDKSTEQTATGQEGDSYGG